MTRTHLLAVALLALTASGAVGAQRAVRERSVFVGVTKDDKSVPDLTPADFIVREDNAAREVLRVSPAPPPSHIALLVDDSAATQSLTTDLRQGFSDFVRAWEDSQPTPAFGLMTFGDRPTKVQDYSASVPAILAGIGRVFPRASAGATFIDSIVQTCADLKKAEATRAIIVAFVAEDGPEFSTETSDKIGDTLAAAKASLWVIVLQSRSGADVASREGRERSSVIGDRTRESGGDNRPILSRQSIGPAFKALAATILSRYEVVYGRPESIVPPKRIEVQTRRKDVRLLAPRLAGQ
jgi:hypothetical protein